jgi:hypothetical protein
MRVASAVAIVALLAACNPDRATAPGNDVARSTSVPAFAKGSGPPIVSLIVTVSNVDGLGNAYGIQNDGQGTYVDGSQNVQAILDGSGTFAFNTFNANHGSATRWITYDFTHPVDPTNTFNPPQDHLLNDHFSTGGTTFSPYVAIQYLGVNGNPSTECGYMGNGFFTNSSTTYRVSFHKGYEDTQNSPTAFAVFTRTSVSPAVWTVQPVGSCSPNSNVASLRSGDGTVLYGYYTIPFFFTLTAK